jgi:hypothetical protein
MALVGLFPAVSLTVAQTSEARLVGLTRDPSGAILQGVTVRATNTNTGFTRQVQTNAQGSARTPGRH